MYNFKIDKITISHKLTKQEYTLWSILLANAYEEFYAKDLHEIDINKLLDSWSSILQESKEIKDLKQALKSLSLSITYTTHQNSKRELGIFVLLSSAEISNGICQYGYAKKFKQFTLHPKISSYLNLWGLNYSYKLIQRTLSHYLPKRFVLGSSSLN